MKYKVKITDTALQDLEEITNYIYRSSLDIKVTKDFIEGVKNKCKSLDTFPNGGSLPRDYVLKCAGYRFVIYKDYLIFYLVDEENKFVNVVAIFNSKKDYIRTLKGY